MNKLAFEFRPGLSRFLVAMRIPRTTKTHIAIMICNIQVASCGCYRQPGVFPRWWLYNSVRSCLVGVAASCDRIEFFLMFVFFFRWAPNADPGDGSLLCCVVSSRSLRFITQHLTPQLQRVCLILQVLLQVSSLLNTGRVQRGFDLCDCSPLLCLESFSMSSFCNSSLLS